MRKRLALTAFATAIGFMASSMAYAANSDLDRSDRRFLQKAAQAGKFEIDASNIAMKRAQSTEVKEFAHKMITDHTAIDQELKTLAQTKGVELPTDLRWRQARAIRGLENEEDIDDLEEDYIERAGVDAHQDSVELFEEAVEDAEDADIKAFASKHLPTLKQHLQTAEALKEKLDDRRDDSTRGTTATPGATTAPAVTAVPPGGANEAVPGAARTGGGTGATTGGGAAVGNAPASKAESSSDAVGSSSGAARDARPGPGGTAGAGDDSTRRDAVQSGAAASGAAGSGADTAGAISKGAGDPGAAGFSSAGTGAPGSGVPGVGAPGATGSGAAGSSAPGSSAGVGGTNVGPTESGGANAGNNAATSAGAQPKTSSKQGAGSAMGGSSGAQ